jgi:hypothetical protein
MKIAFEPIMLGHRSNLEHKLRISESANETERTAIRDVWQAYEAYLADIDWEAITRFDLGNSVEALSRYLEKAKELERSGKFFNWRTDFAASIIPEFLYMMIHSKLAADGLHPYFSKRDSVVELTFAGSGAQPYRIRRKDQDLCLGFSKVDLVVGGEEIPFVVPSLVIEAKTNIDINKLNGLDFSAARLKRTFPGAKYFLATETIDFSLQDNYAAGSIDEVYVLRKQIRSEARRTKGPLSPDVFSSLLRDVMDLSHRATLQRGHVYDRLERGRLISAG